MIAKKIILRYKYGFLPLIYMVIIVWHCSGPLLATSQNKASILDSIASADSHVSEASSESTISPIDHIQSSMLLTWSKLDLLQSFHMEDNLRIKFAKEVARDILVLYIKLYNTLYYDTATWEGIKEYLEQRINILYEAANSVFPQCISDEVGTIRYLCKRLLSFNNQSLSSDDEDKNQELNTLY